MMQNDSGITKPDVEKIADDYKITWYVDGNPTVQILVSRVHEHRDFHVDAEVEILDYTEPNPQLLHPIRTSLTKSFRGLL